MMKSADLCLHCFPKLGQNFVKSCIHSALIGLNIGLLLSKNFARILYKIANTVKKFSGLSLVSGC